MNWLELPRDVWENLLPHLKRPELLALRLTCQAWKESVEASSSRLQPRIIETVHQASVLSLFPHVRELDLSNSVGVSADLLKQILAGLPLLQALSSSGNFSTGNSHLAVIAACTGLQRLSLSGWKALTDSGLHVLGSLCNIRSLRLDGIDGVKGDGLVCLAACRHLQDLSLGLCNLAGIHALNAASRLTSLNFQHSLRSWEVEDPEGPLAKIFQNLSQLQDLEMIWHWADDGQLGAFTTPVTTLPKNASTSSLTKLILGNQSSYSVFGNGHAKWFTPLNRMPRLTELNLVGKWHIVEMAHLKELKTLTVHQDLGNSSCQWMTCMSQLTALHLNHPEVDLAFFLALRHLSSLVILEMTDVSTKLSWFVTTSRAAEQQSPQLQSISQVHLSRCSSRVMDAFLSLLCIKPIYQLPLELDQLVMEISQTSTCDTHRHPKLIRLVLGDRPNIYDMPYFGKLSSAMPFTTLQHLDLTGTGSQTDDGFRRCLPCWTALTYLDVSTTHIGDDFFIDLPILKSLSVLAACQTSVTGNGLAPLLKLSLLKHLNLACCSRLTVPGIASLAPLANSGSLLSLQIPRPASEQLCTSEKLAACFPFCQVSFQGKMALPAGAHRFQAGSRHGSGYSRVGQNTQHTRWLGSSKSSLEATSSQAARLRSYLAQPVKTRAAFNQVQLVALAVTMSVQMKMTTLEMKTAAACTAS
ncbi:hypothetical protein WJX74_010513 [Apatococcus lobatus]|uniref:F-box domain-containing protein n=1 Tax=Apatococcus lobatus TaxID=904363 RepID=A0AAW1QGW6_9CHLO